MLVSAVNLFNILYDALPLGGEGGDEQSNAGTDIRGGHHRGAQLLATLQADDDGAVRVTKGDLRSHRLQFVHKEQPALEHLLVDKHTAPGLNGRDEGDTDQVRGKARPRGVGNGQDRAVHIGLHLVAILLVDDNVVALNIKINAQFPEGVRDNPQVLNESLLSYIHIRLLPGMTFPSYCRYLIQVHWHWYSH